MSRRGARGDYARASENRRLHRNLRPGATNLVTGIATAYLDSIQVITGNVNVNLIDGIALWSKDITGITTPITKHTHRSGRPSS